jgi:holo-[acyl-carrier protein] synthase
MAIKGIGLDIIEISRMYGAIERGGEKFVGRIFTPAEIDLCAVCESNLACSAGRFAGRWAAKEAFYKALPGDIQPLSSWKSVQILADGSGRPFIDVCDGRLRQALADCGVSSVHVSISHEKAYCAAVAVIE